MEEAFKNFKYMPYTALSHSACEWATNGEETVILNELRSFVAKGLDCCHKCNISMLDWLAASKACEDHICFHHGSVQADAFAAHHRIMIDLSQSSGSHLGWSQAIEYDIQQHEATARDL